MISLDVKPEATTTSSSLGLSSKEEKSTLSFSKLLKGVSLKKDKKVIQNGALVLSLNSDTKDIKLDSKKDVKTSKSDILLSLLKGNKKGLALKDIKNKDVTKSELILVLNPQLTKSLSANELKSLVKDAKNYLKHKILASEEFKKFELKELPKTLKGLAQVAKKFGIDVSKITIEKVKLDSKLQVKHAVLPKVASKIENVDNIKEIKTAKVGVKEKVTQQISDTQTNVKLHAQVKTENKKVETLKEIKSTPLFKAQIPTEHTTEQVLQTKQFKVDKKTPKQKADETLKLLISGEQAIKKDVRLTSDFSVASAKLIAPEASKEVKHGLEKLLKSDNQDAKDVSKTDGLTISKADSFEVKINEAKQMVKYLSQDVKTAIEDYKSPFTRVKVQLNPQRLGEVDLTIVQRGKNLHINLSSNNAAINTLAMNANDLKVQLANSGINNASLNFNNNPQGDNSQSGQQQQQRQNEQKANDEYGYFEHQEEHEEILSSLEIVVPHYA